MRSVVRCIATCEKSVIMGYICSCCESPMLSVLCVEAKGHNNVVRTRKLEQIEQMLSFTAQKIVLEKIREIEQCKKICTTADVELEKSSMLSIGSFSDMSVKEFGQPCPNCGSCEPWMPARLSEKDLLDLKEENFPTIFESYEEAEAWALKANEEIIAKMNVERQSAQTVEAAKGEADRLGGIMADLEGQRASLPELAKRKLLKEEKAACLSQKENLGMLDFKGRKAINEKLKLLTYQLERNGEEIGKAQQMIDKQLRKNRVLLEKAQAIIYGCTGRTFKRKIRNAVSFQAETNKHAECIKPGSAVAEGTQKTPDIIVGSRTVVERAFNWNLVRYRVYPGDPVATGVARFVSVVRSILEITLFWGSIAAAIYFICAAVSLWMGGEIKEFLRAAGLVFVLALADFAYLYRARSKEKGSKTRK